MKPDLKSMTRKELEKLKADVEKALDRVAAKEMKAALAAAEKAAAAHGFSLAEITGDAPAEKKTRKSKTGPKKPSAPRFKNPENPDQTWTGKGRQPEWYKAAIAAGNTPEQMEIK
ncbi:H-NS histone family protein [Yoonia sediminilitoris]|uniref:DNA-binding protein H-NS n=1 Tax=Yoonia sediminilitoris TaxID=1286148 RepID=A0A2T6KKD8_9RHOB|nr:H-NS histone family protein [Yoonia sediminilitoris]PUB16379.1 DNA-binding protein H-NS [Yoonia sediminilitoris]RCW96728.1 DNA-binding protein H-NS [Yoonia sediminilitoris]